MGALSDLGLDTADGGILLISAPDSVLAEAGAMKPRPAFVSNLLTAHPAARILWWPERQQLDPGTMRRLAWMVVNAPGEAWLIIDPAEEESPTAEQVREALGATGLEFVEEQAIGRGEVAVRVRGATAPSVPA
jgi:hypothetical protein